MPQVYKQDGRLKMHIKEKHADAAAAEPVAAPATSKVAVTGFAGGSSSIHKCFARRALARRAAPSLSPVLMHDSCLPTAGKYPRTLLQEYCQKQKHGKPRFSIRAGADDKLKRCAEIPAA